LLAKGDPVTLLPGSSRRARAREVQVHDVRVAHAAAGQRVAVNLGGVSVGAVARGDVLVGPGSELRETFLLDAELDFQRDALPDAGARVQIHHGTRESPARLVPLGERFWQIRLEQALIAAADDRLVVRRIAPPDTLGGGRVLDPHPRKHRADPGLTRRLRHLAAGEQEPAGSAPVPQPPRPAAPASALGTSAIALEARLRAAGFEPPLDSELDPADLAALREAGRAVRVTRSLHYHPDTIATVRRLVAESAARNDGAITIAELRDRLGTSRKFAQALLEHLDAERVTIRRGDQHYLRGRHSTAG
jgi:selenocysteine-specific elongation factor